MSAPRPLSFRVGRAASTLRTGATGEPPAASDVRATADVDPRATPVARGGKPGVCDTPHVAGGREPAISDRRAASREGARGTRLDRRAGRGSGRRSGQLRLGLQVLGVDFTSAPRAAKPITVARAWLRSPEQAEAPATLVFESVQPIDDFAGFEAVLASPGPWVGGFDFPFGLPREAVEALDWPREWTALVAHCAALGREAFRSALDAHRQTRPWGARYEHRAGDRAAGSHSPLKLVNPPVGLMFLEGAPRLARAGLHLPGLVDGDRTRVALEAYPGHWVRLREREPYKSDTPAKQTAARKAARERIVRAMLEGDVATDLVAELPDPLARCAIDDASGDTLDAMVCALQAAAAARQADTGWGLPDRVDPLEGWIVGVMPWPSEGR